MANPIFQHARSQRVGIMCSWCFRTYQKKQYWWNFALEFNLSKEIFIHWEIRLCLFQNSFIEINSQNSLQSNFKKWTIWVQTTWVVMCHRSKIRASNRDHSRKKLKKKKESVKLIIMLSLWISNSKALNSKTTSNPSRKNTPKGNHIKAKHSLVNFHLVPYKNSRNRICKEISAS